MFKLFFSAPGILMQKLFAAAAQRDSAFKKLIGSRNITIVIKTANNSEVVQYALKDGRIYLRETDHPAPDLAVTFSGAAAALLIILKPTPKMLINSVMNAFLLDDLKIEGKAEPLMWFFTVLQQMLMVFGIASGKRNKS